ncbi:hydrogen peroxide-inducible genes activator [Cohaesibacter gelatinilyticus]|uniref:LysR family transcriptional regulator, hydrogen peroxide-inducible genes activator n=1 Tax=Cohaesibacter gelatinilyticus TaxID=372072 RepID=A0A285PD30_9HYPH|nr:hydrogen peroxide-inducible genes activator [Cohaesibacter gelatinilyticus]SNZ19622.1 LysR family transcriptional regulator, hydrogen peroxide-inducible genes activator [Cohaesibacter gelatinilyticus]
MRALSGITLKDLEYALAVAEEKHFGQAASRCGVSQPAISQQIRKMEDFLGLSLFERSGKYVKVTKSGALILEKSREIIGKTLELSQLSKSLSNPMELTLTIGIIPTICPYLIPHLIRPLKQIYPNLKITIIEEPTPILEEMICGHELDIIITATHPEAKMLEVTTLYFEPYVFTCPEDHPLAGRETVNWSEIDKNEIIMLSPEHCLRSQTMALCDVKDQSISGGARSLEMLRQMVALGEGCALLPILSLSGIEKFQGLIAIHKISGGAFGRSIHMIWRSTDPRKPHLKTFANEIISITNEPNMRRFLDH